MSRYQIKGVEKKVPIVVELIEDGDGVLLAVNGWRIFKLQDNGTGKLIHSIPNINDGELQVDEEGKIKLDIED